MTGKRILIVEDHNEALPALTAMLSRRGMHVETAITCGEADTALRAARLRGECFDVILSDLPLPDATVEAAVAWLQKMQAGDCTVLAVAGNTDPDLLTRCVAAGIQVIPRGTPTAGMVETILFALIAADPKFQHEGAEALVKNRKLADESREPPSGAARFLQSAPVWVKVLGIVAMLLGVLGTGTGFVVATYQSIGDRAALTERVRERVAVETAHFDKLDGTVAQNQTRIRSLEDDRLRLTLTLEAVAKQLERLQTYPGSGKSP